MRIDPVFTLCVAVPLILTGLAIVPVSWGGTDDGPASRPAPDTQTLSDTAWIGPLVSGLSAREVEQPVISDQNPLDTWSLVGLVQGDEGVWVTVTGHGEVRTLSIGEALDGFELLRVENGAAVFGRGDEERSLRLPR